MHVTWRSSFDDGIHEPSREERLFFGIDKPTRSLNEVPVNGRREQREVETKKAEFVFETLCLRNMPAKYACEVCGFQARGFRRCDLSTIGRK
jgi:hypothetical protein